MILGVAFSLLIFGAGWLVLRVLDLGKESTSLGLAPALGFAALSAICVARAMLGLPPLLGTLAVVGLGVAGLTTAAVSAWDTRLYVCAIRQNRLAFVLLACAVLVPICVSAVGFRDIDVPLATVDSGYHVEEIQALENGAVWQSWYPPGFHATVAAFLGLVPWVDTARGSLEAAFALSYLAPLAVFGLGCAVWRSLKVAGAGALLIALTFEYPYYPQVWGGWPLAAALLLVWGLWATALEYVERPRISLAICAGLLAGGILVTHGSEVYTVVLGLLLVLIAGWRRLSWGDLMRHLPLALFVATVVAAAYLPALVGWARGGGAVDAAYASLDGGAVLADSSIGPGGTFAGVPESTWTLWTSTFGAGLEVDFPVRLVLAACGVVVAFRSGRGRLLVALLLVFFFLSEFLRAQATSLARQVFALTFPWGIDARLATVEAVAAALLGGAGAVAVGDWITNVKSPGLLRVARATAVLLVSGSAAGLAILCAGVAAGYNSYTTDDAMAMHWLSEHVQSGEVLANDASVDAGIWAPYKAHVAILTPQVTSMGSTDAGRAMLRSLGHLEEDAAAQSFACTEHIRYLYHGAQRTAWKRQRNFPSVDELRRSPLLEEVFSSGQAAVFKVRLSCA